MNIGLVVLDTLREDFARKYLDKIFKEFGFQRFVAYSTSNWTIPSHFSMFTGLLPSEHGIHEIPREKEINRLYQPIWEYDTIMKISRAFGYSLVWITANSYLSEDLGYSGFDKYYYIFPGSLRNINVPAKSVHKFLKRFKLLREIYGRLRKRFVKGWPLEKGISKATSIIRNLKNLEKNRKVFIFVNLLEAHYPYVNYPKIDFVDTLSQKVSINRELQRRLEESYLKSVLYLQEKLHSFVEAILNLLDQNSLIIFTSDHGELLGEHNLIGHQIGLWEELIRVPLWIKTPYEEEVKVKNIISLKNIYKILFDATLGKDIDYKKLESKYAFSENWGTSTMKLPENLSRQVEKYRIRCTSAKGSVIYNVDDDKIEWKEGHWKDCYEKIKKYIENP